jgi:hypothetical protein
MASKDIGVSKRKKTPPSQGQMVPPIFIKENESGVAQEDVDASLET